MLYRNTTHRTNGKQPSPMFATEKVSFHSTGLIPKHINSCVNFSKSSKSWLIHLLSSSAPGVLTGKCHSLDRKVALLRRSMEVGENSSGTSMKTWWLPGIQKVRAKLPRSGGISAQEVVMFDAIVTDLQLAVLIGHLDWRQSFVSGKRAKASIRGSPLTVQSQSDPEESNQRFIVDSLASIVIVMWDIPW